MNCMECVAHAALERYALTMAAERDYYRCEAGPYEKLTR